jgi:Na+-transporting NADH:ubiquinone oxidoreductase subunit A
MTTIRRGLDIPIAGKPEQSIDSGPRVRHVALVGDDYVGMRPAMQVDVGDRVKLGQVLFTDRKTEGVQYTSPACGEVVEVNRGEKRRFESIVIRLEGNDEVEFPVPKGQLDRAAVQESLVASGLWTALRTRPFDKVPAPDSTPHSIFVTAMDTRPLAPDPLVILRGREADFVRGLRALACLTDGTLYVCKQAGADVPGSDLERVSQQEFGGPHPAGLPGTHIHFLDPVGEAKTVWHVDYQDVMAVGSLLHTGRLPIERVISLAGPAVKKPRLLRTRIGASAQDLVAGELDSDNVRVISGSVLSGRTADGTRAYLGRRHLQVSVVSDERTRSFMSWLAPGRDKFSVTAAFASAWMGRGRRFAFTTSAEGDPRSIIPIGVYEKVMPLDIVPTALLKALMMEDMERSQSLGCLELNEEDLALCAFVCPGKSDFGTKLRQVLTRIEKEG